LDSGQVEQMPIAKLVMSEEERGLVIQKVKVKSKKKRIKN
jgi:IS4 transposase